jgi:hypothetical protein
MSDQITLWTMARSVPEAVEAAKVQARADGWRVLTVAKVTYRATGTTPAWDVTLAVRPAEVAP